MEATHWFLLQPGDYLTTSHPGHGWMSTKTCTDGTRALTICRPDQSLSAVNRRLSSRISRPIAVFAVVLALVMQMACLTTHGVVVDDRTGWVDEADVRRAVEIVFDEDFWDNTSPGLEIAFVTTRVELEECCDYQVSNSDHGCYWDRGGIGESDAITVLLPERWVCLADPYESLLVHELVHRWQSDHDWPSGHPVELFGKHSEGGHGGRTGELEVEISAEICPKLTN